MGYFGRIEVGGALAWVGGIGRECLEHYFGWAVVSGEVGIILGGWGWVGMSGGGWG